MHKMRKAQGLSQKIRDMQNMFQGTFIYGRNTRYKKIKLVRQV